MHTSFLLLALATSTTAFASNSACTPDSDGDGFCSTDCDDANGDVYPGAVENLLNGIDDDCDLKVDEVETPTWTAMHDYSADESGGMEIPFGRGDTLRTTHGTGYRSGGMWLTFSGGASFEQALEDLGIDPLLFNTVVFNDTKKDPSMDWIVNKVAGQMDFAYVEQAAFANFGVGSWVTENGWGTNFHKVNVKVAAPACTSTTCTANPSIDYDTGMVVVNGSDVDWYGDDLVPGTQDNDDLDPADLGSNYDQVDALEYGHALLNHLADAGYDTRSLYTKMALWTKDEDSKEESNKSGLVLSVPDMGVFFWGVDKGLPVPNQLAWGTCMLREKWSSTTSSAAQAEELVERFASAGLLRGYHAYGQGLKLVHSQTGTGVDVANKSTMVTGLYIAFDASEQSSYAAVDTGDFTCVWND